MSRLFLRSTANDPAPITGLDFPANGSAGSDIRLVFTGANMPPRNAQTVIWLKKYTPGQVGYHADTWSSPNTGSWDGGAYSFGAHGHPCDGTYDPDGQRSNPTFGSGTVQYFEIAGVDEFAAGLDHIAIPMEPAFVLNQPGNGSAPAQAGTWLAHARSVELISSGTVLRHRAWPDVFTQPNDYIEMLLDVADLGSAGSAPAFYFGASDWRAGVPSAGRNDETPFGVMRGLRIFNAALAIADIQAEVAAALTGTNAPASSAGTTALWYINDNPTVADTTDKSGAGHNPSWANSNRPADWSE